MNWQVLTCKTSRLLQGYQVDWEAILSPNPAAFISSVSPWLYPAAAREPVQAPSGTGGLQAASAKLDSGIAEAQPSAGMSVVCSRASLRSQLAHLARSH